MEFVFRVNLAFRHQRIFGCIEGRHLRFRCVEFPEVAAGVGQAEAVGVGRYSYTPSILEVVLLLPAWGSIMGPSIPSGVMAVEALVNRLLRSAVAICSLSMWGWNIYKP